MAHHALTCLVNTVDRFQFSSRITFQFGQGCSDFLCDTRVALEDLLNALKEKDEKRRNVICSSERVMRLDEELRQAASNLEDSIESQFYAQILSQSESDPIPQVFIIDLREIHDQFQCFLSMAERMKAAYGEEDDDEAEVSPPIYFDGGETPKVVGFTDLLYLIIFSLVEYPDYRGFSVCGMAGIGKTTAVKKVLEDPKIQETFDRRIFVPVGLEPKVNYESQFKRILQAILAQVKPESDVEVENVDETFWESLNDEKTLIVLDDVWTVEILIQLRRMLPSKPTGCRILVTARSIYFGYYVDGFVNIYVPFMNKEESWELLRGRVFGEEAHVPEELEKAGKKIAENCEGLPLLLVTVANLLSGAERTTEFWNMVAADKENHIFVGAYDQISEVLIPSYYNLPLILKTFFLFLCAFPQNHQFLRSRLIKLFSGEKFYYLCIDVHTYVTRDLRLLEWDYMVLVHSESKSHGVKDYSLHSGFWHLCKKLAANVKVLKTFNRYADASTDGIGQRRLAIYKNVLLCIKHIYDSVASVRNARSLLCTGPYHQYQVPICFDRLRLLRVLDALSIRFYMFPIEVLQLILLRYLSLTCNGNLPPSISKLWNLQCLIVHKHLSIKYTLTESYLPVEIWDLQELEYLEIMGRNLPDPPPGASLPVLSTLLDVDAHSCTRDVLQSVPKLKKLRVQIELPPNAAECLSCFDHISHPPELKSFQCIVKNPKIVAPPPLPIFGSGLAKLTLRGFGYPWKEMNKIAVLPSLKVLKLQFYAFRGAEWEAEKGFPELENLVIEDTDLMQWTRKKEAFPSLCYLTVKDCYKLQNIPAISTLKEIKVVDCNPTVVTCAKKMETRHREVSASCSWEEGSLKP